MTVKHPWEERAVCPCGFHLHAPFGSLLHVRSEYAVCPKCGLRVSEGWNFKGCKKFSWTIQTGRKVVTFLGVWWNPLSWVWETTWEWKD